MKTTILNSDIFNPIHANYVDEYPLAVVTDAVLAANMLLMKDEFYKRVAALSPFAMATVSPTIIAALLRSAGIGITVGVYYSICPDKKIDGFDNECNPNEVFLNFWTLDRSIASLCNTIVHGCVHAVNAQCSDYYFGHGDEHAADNDASAPYAIGSLAESMIGNPQPYALHHDPYEGRIRQIKQCIRSMPRYPA